MARARRPSSLPDGPDEAAPVFPWNGRSKIPGGERGLVEKEWTRSQNPPAAVGTDYMAVSFPSFMPPAQALSEGDSMEDRTCRKEGLGNTKSGSVGHKVLVFSLSPNTEHGWGKAGSLTLSSKMGSQCE